MTSNTNPIKIRRRPAKVTNCSRFMDLRTTPSILCSRSIHTCTRSTAIPKTNFPTVPNVIPQRSKFIQTLCHKYYVQQGFVCTQRQILSSFMYDSTEFIDIVLERFKTLCESLSFISVYSY